MATSALNISDLYNSLFYSLTDKEKVNLATKLLNSLHEKIPTKSVSADPFANISGAWDDGKSVAETENELRAHRTFTREIETW